MPLKFEAAALIAMALCAACGPAQAQTFVSRAGYSAHYPDGWQVVAQDDGHLFLHTSSANDYASVGISDARSDTGPLPLDAAIARYSQGRTVVSVSDVAVPRVAGGCDRVVELQMTRPILEKEGSGLEGIEDAAIVFCPLDALTVVVSVTNWQGAPKEADWRAAALGVVQSIRRSH